MSVKRAVRSHQLVVLTLLAVFVALLHPAITIAQTAKLSPQVTASPEPPDTEEQRIQDLVTANHILADQGVLDGFGHVSVRSLKNPSHYYIARRQAAALVTREDILEFDEDSQPADPKGPTTYSERYIHGEIYRLRHDVQAVVHSHSPAVIPFGVTNVPLRPIMHMAGFLSQTTPIFEIRKVAGDDNGILVTNAKTGSALATALGNSAVVLMRGHGIAVVASSLRDVVFRGIYTQEDAQIEAEALRLGSPVFLNEMEAAKVDAANSATMLKAWDLWAAQAKARALPTSQKP